MGRDNDAKYVANRLTDLANSWRRAVILITDALDKASVDSGPKIEGTDQGSTAVSSPINRSLSYDELMKDSLLQFRASVSTLQLLAVKLRIVTERSDGSVYWNDNLWNKANWKEGERRRVYDAIDLQEAIPYKPYAIHDPRCDAGLAVHSLDKLITTLTRSTRPAESDAKKEAFFNGLAFTTLMSGKPWELRWIHDELVKEMRRSREETESQSLATRGL